MGEDAGIWLRVSTKRQEEESQRPEIMRWVNDHVYTVKAEYVIHGFSAFKGDRKFDRAWAQVLEDMRTGKITVLVVWKLNRIDRKLNAMQMLQQVVEAGGRVEFVSQAHLNNLTTMGGRLALHVEEEIAHAESEGRGDNVKLKHTALRAQGSLVGRPAWGQEIRKLPDGRKVLVWTPEARKYVPQIYQKVVNGETLRSIARWLTEKGVKTRTGKAAWHESWLGTWMIRSPAYMGQRRNSGELEVEALVSATTWQQANAALKARLPAGRGTTKRPKVLLSKLICGECFHERQQRGEKPSPMYRIVTRQGPHYRCTGTGAQRKGCGSMAPVETLDADITEAMLSNDRRHVEYEFVPGDDRSQQIAKLEERANEAAKRKDYATAMEALRRAEELHKMRRVKPHWKPKETSQTEAEWYASLTEDERRDYLASHWKIIAHRHEDGEPYVTLFPRELLPTE